MASYDQRLAMGTWPHESYHHYLPLELKLPSTKIKLEKIKEVGYIWPYRDERLML